MFGFYLKKAVSSFFDPLTGFGVLGIILLIFWVRSKKKSLLIASIISFSLPVILACPLVANILVSHLESIHQKPSVSALLEQNLRQVVILGGGVSGEDGEQLTPISIARLFEGYTLAEQLNGFLIVSGGAPQGGTSEASLMKDFLFRLKFPTSRVYAEDLSLDTEDQARFLRTRLKDYQFILVTSSLSMPRAMQIFRAHELNPVAYPVGSSFLKSMQGSLSFLPSSSGLSTSKAAIHEFIGMLWYKMLFAFLTPAED